jgi:HlyD family secretion protein
VLVELGDGVERGELLARLDTSDLELQVRSAEASLKAARAQLERLRAGPRGEEISVAEGQLEAAQAALDQAIAQRDQLLAGATEAEIAAAQSAVESARANLARVKAGPTAQDLAAAQAVVDSAAAALRQAQANYDRVKDQPDLGMLPESLALQNASIELKRAQANYEAIANHPTTDELAAAASQLANAKAQLTRLESSQAPQVRVAEANVAAAQAQRDVAQAQLDLLLAGSTAADIAASEAQVEQAEVAVDRARLALDSARLLAPFDGRIARVQVQVGELIGPQTPAFTLVDDTQFTIEVDVDETDVDWIQLGHDVAITLDALPGQVLSGTVISISPLADSASGIVSYRVTIETEASDLPLRSGMTANAEIVREEREDALRVPNLAISFDPATGAKYVSRQTGESVEVVQIRTGMVTAEFSEVLSGLAEGEEVVVSSTSSRDQFRDMMGSTLTGGGQ